MSTELALTGGKANISDVSQICSKGLVAALTKADSADAAARFVGMNPTLKAEAERAMPVLMAAVEPISELALKGLFAEAVAIYGVSDRAPAEWGTMFRHYHAALGELPESSIRAGLAEWNKGKVPFLPKPGQWFELADKHATALRMVAWRARKAAEYEAPKPATERVRLTREEMIERGWLGADGHVILPKANAMPNLSRPSQTPQQMAEALRRAAGVEEPI